MDGADLSSASGADAAQITAGLNRFAVDLYRQVRHVDDCCLCPFSAAMAVALLHLGARGETRAAIDRLLRGEAGPADPHAALGALLSHAVGGGKVQQPFGETIEPHELTIANSLWVAGGHPLRSEYLGRAEAHYNAVIDRIDGTQPEASAVTINQWVAGKTRGRIHDLMQPQAIHALTRLIVVNGVYFKARWWQPFDPARTIAASFLAESGRTVEVSMMRKRSAFPYAEDEDVQVVELAYWSAAPAELSMVIVLPKRRDGLRAVEEGLNAERLDRWTSRLRSGHEWVDIELPRWRAETSCQLEEPLAALGLGVLFSGRADLGGISEEPGLQVDAVVHKTFIDVDEYGTEAAAASAMLVAAGRPSDPRTFLADHPFLYVIRERTTGAVLFLGRVATAA